MDDLIFFRRQVMQVLMFSSSKPLKKNFSHRQNNGHEMHLESRINNKNENDKFSPNSLITPSAAPVTSKFPLWLKAVQLMATGSGSRENWSYRDRQNGDCTKATIFRENYLV